jgi:hypothetical protein
MHVNMSIWKDGKPLFAGDKYADLSQEALYFIGGILKHAKALNAITNPTTNSYKRLIPGFEAPVLRAFSARNRSGCVRIPWSESPKAKRVEARFPDPAANPYLCFAALLMAGRNPHRLRLAARGSGRAGEGSRVPVGWRRVHQRPAGRLHGAEVGRGLRLRAHTAPNRVQDVLQLLIHLGLRQGRASHRGALFCV